MQAAEEHEAAEAATHLVIQLGLAAFAVSAYIKTVLCPSMSSYTPRMSSASLVGPLKSHKNISSRTPYMPAATHCATVSPVNLLSTSAEARMHTMQDLSVKQWQSMLMCCMQAADLARSGGAFTTALLQRQSASLGLLPGHSQSGTPRMLSASQLGTPNASLDKLQREDMLMHELDQVKPSPWPATQLCIILARPCKLKFCSSAKHA